MTKKSKSKKKRIEKEGCFYLLKSQDLYKIGHTSNLRKRLSTIKMHNPFGVEVIFARMLKNHGKVETEVKTRLRYQWASTRMSGEWYLLPEETLKRLQSFIMDEIKE